MTYIMPDIILSILYALSFNLDEVDTVINSIL